ncbi:Protein of unknown function [Gryllus bimaculatus]|nr:Protein of unknown function [Gryllus bimaculatus]
MDEVTFSEENIFKIDKDGGEPCSLISEVKEEDDDEGDEPCSLMCEVKVEDEEGGEPCPLLHEEKEEDEEEGSEPCFLTCQVKEEIEEEGEPSPLMCDVKVEHDEEGGEPCSLISEVKEEDEEDPLAVCNDGESSWSVASLQTLNYIDGPAEPLSILIDYNYMNINNTPSSSATTSAHVTQETFAPETTTEV